MVINWDLGFPGSSVGEESTCNAGDPGPIPGLGRFLGEGNGYPLQYSCWEIPWTEEPGELQSMGLQELDTTEATEHQHNWDLIRCPWTHWNYMKNCVCVYMHSMHLISMCSNQAGWPAFFERTNGTPSLYQTKHGGNTLMDSGTKEETGSPKNNEMTAAKKLSIHIL